ncbi:MAG: hypothetical protein WCV93_04820 [Candidatus Shapirobacteria bacterium]|jgi:hypothetical protein
MAPRDSKEPVQPVASGAYVDIRRIFDLQPQPIKDKMTALSGQRQKVLEGCVWQVAYLGAIESWTLGRLRQFLESSGRFGVLQNGSSGFDENKTLWEGMDDDDGQWNKVYDLLSGKNNQLKGDREVLTIIADEVSPNVDRKYVLELICGETLSQLEVAADLNLVAEFVGGLEFDPKYPEVIFHHESQRISGATPDHLSPDCLLSADFLLDDIAIIKHEFVHFLKLHGLVKHDINIPVASAIIQLELMPPRESKIGWGLSDGDIEQARSCLTGITDMDEAYCRYVIGVEADDPIKTIRERQGQEFSGVESEPDETYEQGRKLAILATIKSLDPYLFLARMAQGYLPSEAMLEG